MNAEQRERLAGIRMGYRLRAEQVGPNQAENEACRDAIDAAIKRIERLEGALKTAIAYMKHGDWSNGVTDYSGSIDQGETWAARDIEECQFALEGRD
jgi:hypothetical protein